MSLFLSAQVWKLDLPPQAKFILLAYADEASSWPPRTLNIPRLARKTGYSEQVVATIMGALRDNPTLLHAEAEP